MKKFSTSGSQDNAMQIVTVIGIDLAKNVFALQGINNRFDRHEAHLWPRHCFADRGSIGHVVAPTTWHAR
jgi:hypothetical protein